MSEWKNSIVTYMDLIGIKDADDEGSSRATDLMRQMHSLVEGNTPSTRNALLPNSKADLVTSRYLLTLFKAFGFNPRPSTDTQTV